MQETHETAAHANLKSVLSDLVDRLGGHRTSNGAMCRCPAHDDGEPSLSIRVGRTALLFKCFAGCDVDDVIKSLRGIDRRVLNTSSDESTTENQTAREHALRERARDIWDASQGIAGSLAADYLEARGLVPSSRALRFNRRTPLGPRREVVHRPALIAALHEAGRLVAVERTFLDEANAGKALDLGNARRMLGRPCGGAVVLAPASEVLGLAEGVETALSAAILLDMPVWAALGSERLPHIAVPESITRLVLLPDNDRSGRIGAAKATQAHAREGRQVETIWPPAGFNDWNDVLRANCAIGR